MRLKWNEYHKSNRQISNGQNQSFELLVTEMVLAGDRYFWSYLLAKSSCVGDWNDLSSSREAFS